MTAIQGPQPVEPRGSSWGRFDHSVAFEHQYGGSAARTPCAIVGAINSRNALSSVVNALDPLARINPAPPQPTP
jgi:hypothetical protein